MVCPLKSLIGPLTEVCLPEEAIVDGRIPPTDIRGQDVLRHNTGIYAGLLCQRFRNVYMNDYYVILPYIRSVMLISNLIKYKYVEIVVPYLIVKSHQIFKNI